MSRHLTDGKDDYRKDLKFSDRYAWANSADPDQTAPLIRLLLEEQSDQGLHCLSFHLHLLDALPMAKLLVRILG